jgi:hypothetical protein
MGKYKKQTKLYLRLKSNETCSKMQLILTFACLRNKSNLNFLLGTSATFRGYGVCCLFVLAAFIFINFYQKDTGFVSELPPEVDPHKVPYFLVAKKLKETAKNSKKK